jgi:hypothetical protein
MEGQDRPAQIGVGLGERLWSKFLPGHSSKCPSVTALSINAASVVVIERPTTIEFSNAPSEIPDDAVVTAAT